MCPVTTDARACSLSPKLQQGEVGGWDVLRDQAAQKVPGCAAPFGSVPPGELPILSEPQALPLQRELSLYPAPSLQFHHAPLYLEWAPVGIFSSSAPQTKEPQDPPAGPAEEDRAEPETCKS